MIWGSTFTLFHPNIVTLQIDGEMEIPWMTQMSRSTHKAWLLPVKSKIAREPDRHRDRQIDG